ncbi:MAG: hypothetical protein H6718_29305 [Polyangiaceae bacterium]|nr:hypothetical protein [Myxococcales bacterium]MCB9589548.1 hypothetical protein [Polyangiaceae bacterium]MCB9609176.1 hypothetical protein [Polyangiaceae bacterium]
MFSPVGNILRCCAALLTSGALLMSTGCGVGERANQCNALARQVNQALKPVKEFTDEHPELSRGSGAPADYGELGKRYTQVSEAAKAMELQDDRIIDLRDDYAKLYEETATTCGSLQKAREANDAAARVRATHELKRLERREDSLLKRANALCEPR